MKILTFILVIIFSCHHVHAQEDLESEDELMIHKDELAVPFVAYWNIGDTKNYRVTKKNTKYKNEEQPTHQTTIYEMKCTVTDSSLDSYTLEWEYQNTIFNDIEIPAELQSTLEKYKILKIQYTTNDVGVFQEILNWEEIRNMTLEMIDKLSSKNSDASKKIANAMEPLKKLYATKESISGLLLKELQIFHFPMGVEFNALDTFIYEEELPNFLGGDPVKGNGIIYFENVNMEKGTARLVNELRLDENDAKRVITDLMKSIANTASYNSKKEKKKLLEEMKLEFSKMKIDIQDYNSFNYYFNPGWPIHIHSKRTSTFSNEKETVISTQEIIIEEID